MAISISMGGERRRTVQREDAYAEIIDIRLWALCRERRAGPTASRDGKREARIVKREARSEKLEARRENKPR
jgi:hypothetical protein